MFANSESSGLAEKVPPILKFQHQSHAVSITQCEGLGSFPRAASAVTPQRKTPGYGPLKAAEATEPQS